MAGSPALERAFAVARHAAGMDDVVALAFQRAIISYTTSGGSCRSASITTTAWPTPASMPAVIAT